MFSLPPPPTLLSDLQNVQMILGPSVTHAPYVSLGTRVTNAIKFICAVSVYNVCKFHQCLEVAGCFTTLSPSTQHIVGA